MDSLPVELLRLVYQHCDVDSVRNLRLVTTTLAQVGYDYLILPHFTALAWRDDVKRLHSISSHQRLRHTVQAVTVNLSEVDEYNAQHASYFQHYLQDPEEQSAVLAEAWLQYADIVKSRDEVGPLHEQATALSEAFGRLPNLQELEVTFARCPFDIEVLKDAFKVPSCRKMDYTRACKDLTTIVSAMQRTELTSFSVERLPLEVFRGPADRKLWADSRDVFAGLSRLELTIDCSNVNLPATKFKAIHGLGNILRFSGNVSHLTLRFQNYNSRQTKFLLWLEELVGDFVFQNLTDFTLEGVLCDEAELRGFILRHSATLERLRLGGRGLAKSFERSMGGIHLCRGSFRSLFASLRGRMPRLQRVHLEGDFQCETLEANSNENYRFHAITDDDWSPLPAKTRLPANQQTIDGSEFERFLIEGGNYPAAARGPGISAA
ncbi:uncharacterized protein E0L32_010050 [Thyridium curvatum]|uniref:F-box domain-containing protein n=1 Tax=Thyridium curvatum TaxID=1093900 RepID=A0A507ALI8_9PEZI|nr:uncharacterized protein E0L32_010050 [Thyridium curvatum]TPX08433.1 hypothetical protein E0L32_010050 [Thyridium curvatum]